jgi:hypothetical protein
MISNIIAGLALFFSVAFAGPVWPGVHQLFWGPSDLSVVSPQAYQVGTSAYLVMEAVNHTDHLIYIENASAEAPTGTGYAQIPLCAAGSQRAGPSIIQPHDRLLYTTSYSLARFPAVFQRPRRVTFSVTDAEGTMVSTNTNSGLPSGASAGGVAVATHCS